MVLPLARMLNSGEGVGGSIGLVKIEGQIQEPSVRIAVVFNPISGAGRAASMGQSIADRLKAAGHDVMVAPTQRGPCQDWLDPVLKDAELVVVSGGDGAMRMVGEAAIRTNTPVYHLPCGTENLFARAFGMDCQSQTLQHALEKHDIRRIDTGIANGETFLLMASVGFDAAVVHELARCRRGSISHFSYVGPMWRQFRQWRPSLLEIHVDGCRIDDEGPGFVVIANSAEYGWHVNPAARADMFDGVFDVAYFPARSRAALVTWALKCRFRRQFNDRRLVYCRGREVTVRCRQHCHYQLDGDPAGGDEIGPPTGATTLRVQIRPSSLPVLMP
jgi:diacylglycerol kinase (ATP)